jgi:hypothetical protein
MMTSEGKSPFQPKLDSICKFLYKRKFDKAEIYALRLLSDLLENTIDSSHKQFIISLMYQSFNGYYDSWLRKMNYDAIKEFDDLRSLEHDNLFIAYCSNVYAMEVLLKQAFEYFSKPQEPQDVLYYVDNYKMVYLM